MIAAKRRRPWQGEEEVRIAWVAALEAELGIHFDAERARKDSSYNTVIIEFKAPGLFKGSKSSLKFDEATRGRLLPYIRREAAVTGIAAEDYIGIAIDGEHVCFAQVRGEDIFTQHLVPFSDYAVTLVVEAIRAQTRRAVTGQHLLADFGHASPNACSLMQAMADALAGELGKTRNSKTNGCIYLRHPSTAGLQAACLGGGLLYGLLCRRLHLCLPGMRRGGQHALEYIVKPRRLM